MPRIVNDPSPEQSKDLSHDLDEIAREGARRMLVSALEAEVAGYLEEHRDERTPSGRAKVVRNGKGRPRKVTLGGGTVTVQSPRVNDTRVDEDGDRQRFSSKILPPYMRKSPKVSEVLPILYLRGLSTGDFQEALKGLLGEDAGLSPSSITRLLSAWEEEYDEFRRRDLSNRDYVYIWADGVHFNVRLEEERLCTLVLMGVRLDGTKELIAVEDGYRESSESWSAVLRDLKNRGMRSPALAVGDGALGFWKALREVWPETEVQRCWVHKLANVLDRFPKKLQPKAKDSLHEIMYAATKKDAEKAIDNFEDRFGAKYPKAVQIIRKDQVPLLSYFQYPDEHWQHLRSANPIESAFATVRLRQRVTKGAGSRKRGLMMAFKLLEMAQMRWRKVNAPHLVAQVRGGIAFPNGERAERQEQVTEGKESAA